MILVFQVCLNLDLFIFQTIDEPNEPVKQEPVDLDAVYLSDSNSASEAKDILMDNFGDSDGQQHFMDELLGQNSGSDQGNMVSTFSLFRNYLPNAIHIMSCPVGRQRFTQCCCLFSRMSVYYSEKSRTPYSKKTYICPSIVSLTKQNEFYLFGI